MIRIGYLDDEYDYEKNIVRNLKKHDIEVFLLKDVDDVNNINLLIDNILDLKLECIFVDYDLLKLKSKKYGTYVIKELNDRMMSFPCFLLTHYVDQGIEEKLVQTVFVQDKNIFQEDASSPDFVTFILKVKNSAECFNKRLMVDLQRFIELSDRMKVTSITSDEEREYYNLYSILVAYQLVDEMPEYLLYDESNKKLDSIIELLKQINTELE